MWRKLLFTLTLVLVFIACNNKAKSSEDRNDKLEVVQTNLTEEEQVKNMLTEFYTLYINVTCGKIPVNIEEMYSIVRKYTTNRTFMQWNNPEPGYDLFLDANYCETDWINTLSVRKDSIDNNVYVVSWNVNTEEKQKIVRLRILQTAEDYKIDEILETNAIIADNAISEIVIEQNSDSKVKYYFRANGGSGVFFNDGTAFICARCELEGNLENYEANSTYTEFPTYLLINVNMEWETKWELYDETGRVAVDWVIVNYQPIE
jgi:hypothetical protein